MGNDVMGYGYSYNIVDIILYRRIVSNITAAMLCNNIIIE